MEQAGSGEHALEEVDPSAKFAQNVSPESQLEGLDLHAPGARLNGLKSQQNLKAEGSGVESTSCN